MRSAAPLSARVLGGTRQRICVARALSLAPKAIIAHESVSSLDVSIQSLVLELLQDIQNETGIGYLFISHDMAVVQQISHRIAVTHMSHIVVTGTGRRSSRIPSTSTRGDCFRPCQRPTRAWNDASTWRLTAN